MQRRYIMKLYLASKSYSRSLLLKNARIPFDVIGQDADELQCDWELPLEQLVLSIADHKMEHAVLPHGQEGDTILVLTGDTLTQDMRGVVYGKAADYNDAIKTIKALQNGSLVSTGFRLDKKIKRKGTWETVGSHREVVSARCVFNIPDYWIERYLQQEPLALKAAGAMVIEEYGQQFLQSVTGSYSTIMGLPVCEVRVALEKLGFFQFLQ